MVQFSSRSWLRLPVRETAELADLDAHAAPRRLLLLVEGGKPVVLALPSASRLHAELVRQMALHPGQRIAGEYLAERGWVRFLEGRSR